MIADKRFRTFVLLVLLFPIVLHGYVLTGLGIGDPVISYSGLQIKTAPGPGYGIPRIDPSVGLSFQPLGRKSAQEWLSGNVPWWDPDEGIGVPLAGGMIAASFFPLTILQALPHGQEIVDLLVQMASGICTLLLLRRLGVDPLASVIGALLFQCNGTFAWLGAGWCYPMPFIPLLMYGVELVLGRTPDERARGSVIVAVSIALSISAAMIETAYLNGLLCVLWALSRVVTRSRVEVAKRLWRLSLAAIVGIALAAPLIIAFVDYLRVSQVGPHDGTHVYSPLVESLIPQTFLPYIWGPIFYWNNPDVARLWGSVGGYAGTALSFLALCGLFGRYLRAIRIALGAWIALTFAATVGVHLAQFLVTIVPGVRYTAYNRYFDSSREFALAVLVALFIHDVRTGEPSARRYAVATVVIVALVAQGIVDSPSLVKELVGLPSFAVWFWGSIAFGVSVIGGIWLAFAFFRSSRRYAYVLAGVVIGEAMLESILPTFAYPSAGRINEGPVKFLQAHLGLQRMYELGPMVPSLGSYFDVAELNCIGFVAASWQDYITKRLDAYVNPQWFDGLSPDKSPGVPGRDENLRANLAAFENVGVRYVVSNAGTRPLAPVAGDEASAPDAAKSHLVYHDVFVDIDELPNPAPYFSATGCDLDVTGRERVRTHCSQGAVLTRRELFLPGWTARVNGANREVVASDVFQSVALPQGDATVTFDYTPPGMFAGYAAFVLALLATAALALPALRKS